MSKQLWHGETGNSLAFKGICDKISLTKQQGEPVPPKKKIERLSKTIEKLLSARGLSGRLREYRVFTVWEQAVGGIIARHARPSAIRGRKLTVTVDSSAWMQQLSILRPELVEKLNGMLGGNAVEQVTLRIGEIAPAGETLSTAGRPAARPAASLTPEERDAIEHAVNKIADPAVRESFRHLMEKDLLSRQASRRSS